MRFVDDQDLTFCLTISTGIKRTDLLAILSAVRLLPDPQRFDDFDWKAHKPGQTGLLNVFEVDNHLVTLECNGYLGVTYRVVKMIRSLPGDVHYVATNSGDQYVEIKNGEVLANFGIGEDETPEHLARLFSGGVNDRPGVVAAMEHSMGIKVDPEWLVWPTDTYFVDYTVDLY